MPHAAFFSPQEEDVSWGQATWKQISDLLIEKPSFLVLDEPTRHLDLSRRRQLSRWLNQTGYTMVLVSHDLDFLDAVANRTWHLDGGKLRTSDGPPSDYLETLQLERDSYKRQYSQQQRRIRALKEDIAETKRQAQRTESETHSAGSRKKAKKVAQKARARESRLNHYAKSGEQLEPLKEDHSLRYTWDHVAASSGVIAKLESVSLDWSSPCLENISLEVRAGERIGITGDNGSGKSTLLNAILGRFPGTISGYVRPVKEYGYIGQVFHRPRCQTSWEFFQDHSSLPHGMGRAWLQSYGFKERQLFSSLATLSDGELVKLQIAAWSAAGVGVLALDEPEHHLDMLSLDTISHGLRQFPGTMLVVSHHPRFLTELGVNLIWHVADRRVTIESF
ncbi:ATP-binding cassette domain-containing protein [Sulfobacillus sp. hq2]|uniref:ATP-binding cassette domain-containing protein n=1 Tax=Sulfobacillus TaxID=28033 RepID=UPI000CD2C6D9|nr:ATP-binding cassette domain-containing protein [Sulfobacillus sp. hq2]POB11049.1 hypothetical protein CO251_05725 [Sulfobacillus sp. hq2]